MNDRKESADRNFYNKFYRVYLKMCYDAVVTFGEKEELKHES